MPHYDPSPDRYESMPYRRCGRSGVLLPALSPRALAQLRRRPARSRSSAPSCGAPSTSASRTSTWPTTTARPTGAPRTNFGRILRTDLAGLPRRADHLHQGRLGHVARPLRRLGLAQVPAGQPRPEPRPARARLRRHLLLTTASTPTRRSKRPWARWTRPCARARRSTWASPRTPRRTREAVAILRSLGTPLLIHQPSYSHVQPLDRGPAARRARRGGRRVHRVLAARPRACSPTATCTAIPTGSRLTARSSLSREHAERGEPRPRAGPGRHRRGARPEGGPARPGLGPARPARHLALVIGASSVAQLEENVAALDGLDFTAEELQSIETYAVEGNIDLWRGPATS